MLVHSDRSILVRPGLKHVLLSMVIVAFLLSGVKKRYFDQFDHLVRMEMLQSRGTVEPTQPFSAAANAQEPITGLIFNQLIPERVVKSISRLKTLHKIRFESCSPEQDTIDRIAQLPQLRELSFADCNLLQLNLDQLAERENPIESLEIVHCPMTAGQIEAISRMSRLKRLGISDPDLLDQLVPLKELDQLDLRTCRGLEITQLLALEMPKLKRLLLPREEGIIGWKGVPDATLFPLLDTLPIEIAEIDRQVVEQLKTFRQLSKLEVINCRRGFELLAELELKELHLHDCELSLTNLELVRALALPDKLHLQGKIKDGTLQDVVPLAISMAEENAKMFLQLTRQQVDPADFMAASTGMGPGLDDPFFYEYEDLDMIRIDRNGMTRFSGVELEFQQFISILKLGRCAFGRLVVRNGDRIVIAPNESVNLQYGSLQLREPTGAEIQEILKTGVNVSMLDLLNPQLDPEDWQTLAQPSNVGFVNVHTSRKPEYLESAISAFEAGDQPPRLRVYLREDDFGQDEVEAMQREAGPRVQLQLKKTSARQVR